MAIHEKKKVLIVGGSGYLGKRIVKACLQQGFPTFVLLRQDLGLGDIDKLQLLLSFKAQGARLVPASFSDQHTLVDAVKQVDVVISAMSGVHFRSHNLLLQLKLVDAIKEAGNIKQFFPSEFGMDPARMEDALEPGRVTFDEKMQVRKAIEDAQIPYTYVCGACFAGYFAANLCQAGSLLPPTTHTVFLYGGGNTKMPILDEDDIATYTVKAIDDCHAINKTLYLRPPSNVLSQRELVQIWENLSGRIFDKITVPAQEFLASMKEMDFCTQVGMGHFYHVFFEGCLANFEISGENHKEVSDLYPEVQCTSVESHLKRYL